MSLGERFLAYNADENIAQLSFRDAHLKTPQEVNHHFDAVVALWRERCGGRKVYWLVNYEDFSVDMRQNGLYGERMLVVFDLTALAIARYGGSSMQKAAVHLYSMRLHKSSNFYASREEAMDVLRRLRDGEMKQE